MQPAAIIFSADQLAARAKSRGAGYAAAILAVSTPLGSGSYSVPADAAAEVAAQFKGIGLGTAVQKIIHAGVNLAPIPKSAKAMIKQCSSCGKRVLRMNRAVPRLPFT